jgi:Ribbon-helix-helix protein, copG family
MARRKTTVYVDEDLLRAARIEAARSGRSDSDVFEDALRRLLRLDVADRVWARNAAQPLDADEALALAYEELSLARGRRRRPAS